MLDGKQLQQGTHIEWDPVSPPDIQDPPLSSDVSRAINMQ